MLIEEPISKNVMFVVCLKKQNNFSYYNYDYQLSYLQAQFESYNPSKDTPKVPSRGQS